MYTTRVAPGSCAGCSTFSACGMAYTASTSVSGDSAHAIRILRLSWFRDMFSNPRDGRRIATASRSHPTRDTETSKDCDHSALGAARDAVRARWLVPLGIEAPPPTLGVGSFAVL